MARNQQTPLWSQDLVMALALAFAGFAALQGKLFPALFALNLPVLDWLLDWKPLAWWPVLLIVAGVVLWLMRVRATRAKRQPGPAVEGWR